MSSYNPSFFIPISERAVGSVRPRHNDGAPAPLHFNAIDYALLRSDSVVRDQDSNESNVEDIDNIPRKRGRLKSKVWQHFTTASQPQICKSTICKHFKTLINYLKKSEMVKIHVSNCGTSRKLMNGMEDVDRPEWYNRNKKPTRQARALSLFNASSSQQISIKLFRLPAISKDTKAKFQQQIALHFHTTRNRLRCAFEGGYPLAAS